MALNTSEDELLTFIKDKSEYWFMVETKTGNWVVDEVAMMRDLIPYIKERERLAAEKPFVPNLTAETYPLFKALYSRYGDQNYYSYKDLSRESGLSVDKLKELIPTFKKIGTIQHARGLFTDEGETYGSGFGIPHGMQELAAELAIRRYEAELEKEE